VKYVKRQLELIKELCDDMLNSLEQRAAWKDLYLPKRVQEAKAIESASRTLVELVKRRRM